MEKIRAHVIISGLVQGVFFRYETRTRAQGLGISGWVMNRNDGKVEAVFEGEKEDVESITRWCHKGPASAVVNDITIKYEPYTGEFKGFGVR